MEYQRVQTGATKFWTPLRQAGQYHDEETDLNENWNRYYLDWVGRYAESDPVLVSPAAFASRAAAGHSPDIYGYAGNNPTNRADPDGREDSLESFARAVTACQNGNFYACQAEYRDQAIAENSVPMAETIAGVSFGGFTVVMTAGAAVGAITDAILGSATAVAPVVTAVTAATTAVETPQGQAVVEEASEAVDVFVVETGQVGVKFGEHMDESSVGFRNFTEYRELIRSIVADPTSARLDFMYSSPNYAGETWFIRNGVLLRFDAANQFLSMYPLQNGGN
jgi:RHS repeat-associated protein